MIPFLISLIRVNQSHRSLINKHSLIILAFESFGAPARQSLRLWFFDLISIQLHAKDQRISIQEWRANILAQIGRILCRDMADRYDQFDISCGIELGKMAVASSNESLLNDTGSGVGIDDSNIASQDSVISNSSTGSFSEPVRKKQRSSRTVTPTYDPQIQVDGNLVDALKRGRLLSTSHGPLPKRPISMHNYELHLSAGERTRGA
jgi:hypothetical protein